MTTLFDGLTFSPEHDEARLTSLGRRVWAAISDHQWWTLKELQARCGGSEGGIGARLRYFRKEKFGGHNIELRRCGDPAKGLWEYRLCQ